MPGDGLRLADYLGALILLAGIAGEALADAQLKAFRTDPANKGRVCDVGLWRWSRHPNYFFEWFGWLAYPVIGISPRRPAFLSVGFAALLAPVFMYWILVYVTGIPPLEAQMLRSRGDRYRDYQSRTSPVLSVAAASMIRPDGQLAQTWRPVLTRDERGTGVCAEIETKGVVT